MIICLSWSQFFLCAFKVNVQLLKEHPSPISVESQKQKENSRIVCTGKSIVNKITHCQCRSSSGKIPFSFLYPTTAAKVETLEHSFTHLTGGKLQVKPSFGPDFRNSAWNWVFSFVPFPPFEWENTVRS